MAKRRRKNKLTVLKAFTFLAMLLAIVVMILAYVIVLTIGLLIAIYQITHSFIKGCQDGWEQLF